MPVARSRRRVPFWVQAMAQDKLHGLAGKLLRDFRTIGITERQDWLLERCLEELTQRRREAPVTGWCTCELCMEPFPFVPEL